MSTAVRVNHLTRYVFRDASHLGPHIIRLCPAYYARAEVDGFVIAVRPPEAVTRTYYGPSGNRVVRALFPEPVRQLEIEVVLDLTIPEINPFDFFVAPIAESLPVAYEEEDRTILAPYLQAPPEGRRLSDWMADLPASGYTVDLLVEINRRIAEQVTYIRREEEGLLDTEGLLARGAGSCRDTAWLLVQAMRRLGIAARFVSGYLVQLEGSAADAPDHDTIELHAWAEAFLPGAGWIGFDTTSGMLATAGHVPLASGHVPEVAAPVVGTAEVAVERFEVTMGVTRRPAAAVPAS
ncbi:MAG: transglutaminase family protein [Azospirillaceae bacterium]